LLSIDALQIEHAYQARWRLQQQVTAEQWSAVVGRNPWLDDIVTDWDDLNRLLDTIADDDGWTQVRNLLSATRYTSDTNKLAPGYAFKLLKLMTLCSFSCVM